MTNPIMQGLLNAKPATKEARKIAKLKARKMFEFIYEGQSIEFNGYSFNNAAHDAGLMFGISNPNGEWKQHPFEPQKYTWIKSEATQ